MLFSQDDAPLNPTDRLFEVTQSAINCARQISFSELRSRRPLLPDYMEVWPGEHFRLLGGLVQALQPRTVIEIGTYTGVSALAMKEFMPPESRLVTFDIRPWNTLSNTCLTERDFKDGTLTQHADDLAELSSVRKHRELLQSADLIFLDGPHTGDIEIAMMNNLCSLKFDHPPIVLFDDVRLFPMLKFWRELALPKLDLTSFGHWSGSGIAEIL